MPDEKLHPFQISLEGKLNTADDPVTIGSDFQTVKNLRYDSKSLKGVAGMTKVNTTQLGTSYRHLQNGFHFRKEQPTESHVLVQATDTSDANPVILQNTTAIPNQGDFSATVLYTENTSAGVAMFANAPNGQVAMCDGKAACIWGGNEMRLSAFITSSATITNTITNPRDYTDVLQNTLSTADNRASIGGGDDSYTKALLHMDGANGSTTFTDSGTGKAHGGWTAAGNAQIDIDQAKFSQSGLFDGTGDYIWAADHADFDFSGGIFTIDFWVKNRTGTDNDFPVGTYYSQGTDANNYIRLYSTSGSNITFQVVSGGATVVNMTVTFGFIGMPQWIHIAVAENGDSWYLWIDGVLRTAGGVPLTDTNRVANYTGVVTIGAFNNNVTISDYMNANFDEYRISNGIARWTTNFVPPVAPYIAGILDFVIGSTRPLQGCKFYIPTGGNNDIAGATLSVKEWNGSSWTAITITDNTSGLEQTGTVTWSSTESTSKVKYLNGYLLYWYNFTLSAGNCEIYYVTVDTPFQTIKDIWDGELRIIYNFQLWSGTVFNDWTVNVVEDSYDTSNTATFVELDSLATSGYLLLGFLEKTMGISIKLIGSHVNTTTSTTLTVSYWDGGSWVGVSSFVDGTSNSGISFAKSGVITWSPPSVSEEFKKEGLQTTGEEEDITILPLYYYKLNFSQILSADVQLYNVTGIPTQKEVSGYKFPFFADSALWLCSNSDKDKNTVLRSMPNAPDVFNGDDSIELPFGDETELTCATTLFTRVEENTYDIKLFFKVNAIYGLTGNSIDNYNMFTISESTGCPAPLTLETTILHTEERSYSIAIWQGANGIYIYNNFVIVPIHHQIRNFFDENETNVRKLNPSYIKNSVSFIDEEKTEYHWLFADGSSTGTLNREFVFDLKKYKWFEIPRGSGKELQCGFEVIDTNGYNYIYGTIDTGYMERLENGTDFDGTAIAYEFWTGDFPLYEKSFMYETLIRKLGFIMKAKTTTANVATVTLYGDGNNTGTAIDSANGFDPTKSGYRIANIIKSVGGLNPHIFYSFKGTMSTNNETVGFEPLMLYGFYKLIREKTK